MGGYLDLVEDIAVRDAEDLEERLMPAVEQGSAHVDPAGPRVCWTDG